LRTLRGKLKASEKARLIVDDGRFTSAWVVEGFSVFPTNATGPDVQGILATDEDGLTGGWDAADNRQIGWSWFYVAEAAGTGGGDHGELIVPGHIIVRDLWIENFSAQPMNYLVHVRPREISEDQAVLALIQERSQDDL
jgi:hypothetical protein